MTGELIRASKTTAVRYEHRPGELSRRPGPAMIRVS